MRKITRKKLEEIYRENNNSQAAKLLGISVPTMLKYLKENDIPLKGIGSHNKQRQLEVVK